MTEEYHALLSPSGAAKWINCANSLAAEADQPDIRDTTAADLGTDKHQLLASCLSSKVSAQGLIGSVMEKGNLVDQAFADDVQQVLDNIADRVQAYKLAGADVQIEIEQDVPISHITGEVNATGRADVVLIATWPDGRAEICPIDAKFGYREVEVENNPQLMLYAAGALEKFGLVAEFQTVTAVIDQPAIGAPTEWSFSVKELQDWVDNTAAPAAARAVLIYHMRGQRALKAEDFNPGAKQCEWCRAKAVCPARSEKVKEVIGLDFDAMQPPIDSAITMLSNNDLGDIWPALDFIEDWTKAVRGRIEYELLQGREVPGTKLVEGRKGNRSWDSDEEAEKLLKSFRLKQEEMYSFKLLGPKPILDLLKDQPRRAKKVEGMITQKSGKPHVAHVSDKRVPLEIKPLVDEFDPVDPGSDLV
jgi:hypothetical protein